MVHWRESITAVIAVVAITAKKATVIAYGKSCQLSPGLLILRP